MLHPSSFHRAAAAAISIHSAAQATTAVMSTRPSFRGGGRSFRGGRRSYSDRPQNVSGDSHFQSVRDANASFQRNSATTNHNNNNYSAMSYNYDTRQNYKNQSYKTNNNTSSNFVSGGGDVRPRASPPPYNHRPNQPPGRVQRSKPADFRTWEFAKHPPPSNAERFVVLSYNILADYLANGHRKLYFHIPRRFMNWEWRKNNILFELKLWSPDIMCLQEVDRFQELEEDLRIRGYSGIWKIRTGEPVDGCAIFWRTTRFKLMYEECIEFKKHGMRDNVAQICVLESLVQKQSGNQLSLSSSGGPNRVVICNIHVLYNPRRGEIKLGQVRMLLDRAQAVSNTWDDAPIVLCGDFNCTPKSPLYNFISEQKLDVSQIDRDKVSGQASAEIHPPPRIWGHHSRLSGEVKAEGNHVSDVGDPSTSLASNSDKVDEVAVGSSLGAVDETLQDDEELDENAEESLPELHNGEDASPPNLGDVVLEADIGGVDYHSYNPSLWTAMEIATATGDADDTVLEHPLQLRSTYSEVGDSSRTRDSSGEPLVTSYHSCFMGTVDYIWRSEGLQTTKVLAPIPKDVMLPSRGFPTKKWGSDHIALASELAFTK